MLVDKLAWLWEEHFALVILGIVVGLYALYYKRFSSPHFLIKGRYPVHKKNIGHTPPPYSNGWYNVLFSK